MVDEIAMMLRMNEVKTRTCYIWQPICETDSSRVAKQHEGFLIVHVVLDKYVITFRAIARANLFSDCCAWQPICEID